MLHHANQCSQTYRKHISGEIIRFTDQRKNRSSSRKDFNFISCVIRSVFFHFASSARHAVACVLLHGLVLDFRFYSTNMIKENDAVFNHRKRWHRIGGNLEVRSTIRARLQSRLQSGSERRGGRSRRQFWRAAAYTSEFLC